MLSADFDRLAPHESPLQDNGLGGFVAEALVVVDVISDDPNTAELVASKSLRRWTNHAPHIGEVALHDING